MSTESLPSESVIGRTALRVEDLDAMVAFYRDVVGLHVHGRGEDRAVLGVDGVTLLVLLADPAAGKRPRASAGLFHIAFRVPSRGALGDALTRLRNRWELTGASDHGASEALYARDPEGNGLEVYCDRPRDDWERADDGTVVLTSEPLALDRLAAVRDGRERIPPGTDIGHVHLEVTSIEAFEAFYVDTVGFAVQTRWDDASFVAAGDYHHHLGANTWHHRTEPIAGRGLAWFEVRLPDVGALDALSSRLESQNDPPERSDGELIVIDPFGIEVRFGVADAN